jgi:RNA polymerase sigma factor (sigma-70 family)
MAKMIKTKALRELCADPFADLDVLTPREREVARLAALYGMTYVEIGAALEISEATAKTHLDNLTKKLNVDKRELTRLFTERLERMINGRAA